MRILVVEPLAPEGIEILRAHHEVDEKLDRWLNVAFTVSTGGCHLLSRIIGHADPASSDRVVRRSGSDRKSVV